MKRFLLIIPFLFEVTFFSLAFAESDGCHESTHQAQPTQTHCCNTHLMILESPLESSPVPSLEVTEFEFLSSMKPAPDLEGPFQPPRPSLIPRLFI